ncbi:MAG: c-type cytochrome domain-containing protein, partial [Planctomycetaceae bacterium]
MASWSEGGLSRAVRTGWSSVLLVILFLCGCSSACADDRLLFFEQKIRPILVQHCYSCHSAESPELQAGLRLDVRAGWQEGGDAGEPVII